MATAPLSLFLFLTSLFLWLSSWLCLSNNSPRSGQATTRCRGSGLRVHSIRGLARLKGAETVARLGKSMHARVAYQPASVVLCCVVPMACLSVQ
ncbi:hypothetical protein HDV57DRAFT_479608 [Trichoderma longibrachiatum]